MKHLLLVLAFLISCSPAKLSTEVDPLPAQTSTERNSLRRINSVSLGTVKSSSGLGVSEINRLFTEKFTSNAGLTVTSDSNVRVDITVNEFQERVGSQIGVISPASVRVTIQFLEDGKIIWSGSYSNSQGAVSENFLSKDIKAEEGFSSGRELLVLGFEKISQEFGAQRMKAFLK